MKFRSLLVAVITLLLVAIIPYAYGEGLLQAQDVPQRQLFWDILLNNMGWGEIAAYTVYAFLGLFVSLIVDIVKRDPKSETSPQKFSLSYWWNDNWRRLIVTAILIPIVTVLWNLLAGQDINQLNAFYIGWSGDYIAEFLKRKGIIGSQLPIVESNNTQSNVSNPK